MKNYISNQSGRSMIEMLGVLAIVGVLSVAGIAGYSKAMAKYKTNKVVEQISTVVANIKTAFAGQGDYKGMDSYDVPYNLGAFPDEMTKDIDAIGPLHALGGLVNVYSAPDQYSFAMELLGLSKDACTAIVTTDWGSSAGFLGISGGAEGCDNGICPPSVLQGKTVSMISELCTGTEGKNDYNTVLFFK